MNYALRVVVFHLVASLSMGDSHRVDEAKKDAIIAMMPGSVNWNTFLVDLWAKLSSYDVQKDRNNYNVADLEYWGESGREQGIHITESNFGSFINKTARYGIREYDSIRGTAIEEPQLRDLNHILDLTLKRGITRSCSISNELVIKGSYVKFSDFIGDDGNPTDGNGGCGNLTAINIFALNTVFADRDVRLIGRKIDLSIVSPKWEIIDSRIIDLSGSDHSPVSDKIIGAERRRDGRDGEPGLPGMRGGNFFGIGEEFVNGGNLSIIVNGGRGGAGGDGEDGENGFSDDRHVKLDNKAHDCFHTCTYDTTDEIFIFTDANRVRWTCNRRGSRSYMDPYYDTLVAREWWFVLSGPDGSDGKNGGNGGKGGPGGSPGKIILFELNDHSGVTRYNDTGKNGRNGEGGKGGDGGSDADLTQISCYGSEMYDERGEITIDSVTRKNGSHANGLNGTDGTNERGMLAPESGTLPKPAKVIINYRHYLHENLNDPFQKYGLYDFLRKLDTNNGIKGAYDTIELFNELKDLEEQFYYINDNVDVVPLYQSLLNRISEYAESPKDIENSNQYKKILTSLYAATLGKISYLNDPLDSSLIIDMEKHLDLIKADIESMRNLQISSRKIDLINNYKRNYKSGIDRQIDEAKYAIEQLITPSMNDIAVRLDDKIVSLVGEMREMERLADNERRKLIDEKKQLEVTMEQLADNEKRRSIERRKKLDDAMMKLDEAKEREIIEKREQLQTAILWKGLFGGLRIVGKIVSHFGPIGSVIGKVIEPVSNAAESWLVGDDPDEQQNLRSKILTYMGRIETAKNEQVKHLNDLLLVVSQEMTECPDKFNDTVMKIDEMKDRLNEADGDRFDRIKGIENELKVLLRRKKEELTGSMKKINNDGKTMRAMAAIGRIDQAVQIYGVGFGIYDKFKKDRADIDAISAAIAQRSKIVDKLRNNEQNIYDITIPMLRKTEDNLRGIVNDLDGKSGVSLDITRWQVQRALKDIKLRMKKLTRMFDDLHDDLPHCIEMLDDAITAMINIYDRIQDYQREEKFVNFNADMSHVRVGDGNITDSRLDGAVNVDYLESLIRSNHVITKYKVAIEGFKNFVFPLAHVYLRDFALPTHLQLENNFDNLLSTATAQIDRVKSKLTIYKTHLNGAGYNPYIKLAPFTSFYASTRPFYVWRNARHGDLIGKLLSGERVIVRSDVRASPAYRDAIKFSVAVFYFKAQNSSMQAEIDGALRGFEIEATHLGDSHYRCDNTIYRITGNNVSISYYLERRPDGEPVSASLTYIGLKEKDSVLSPYATWEVTLLSSTDAVSHRDLDKYKAAVDLELMGNGNYIDNRRVDYSRLDISKYYRDIGTYSQIAARAKPRRIGNAAANHRNARSIDAPSDNHSPLNASIDLPSLIAKAGSSVRKTASIIKSGGTAGRVVDWLGLDRDKTESGTSGDFDVNLDGPDVAGFDRNTVLAPVGSTVEQFTNGATGGDGNSVDAVNYDSFDENGNLLLPDLVFRKKNSTGYENHGNSIRDHSDR